MATMTGIRAPWGEPVLLDQLVKDFVLGSRKPAAAARALADLGIGPCYATWSLRAAADALGLDHQSVVRRLSVAVGAGAA
jgi:hypothetical protein